MLVFVFLLSNNLLAKSEKDYQKSTCSGEIEYVLTDKTRVDCLTKDTTYEYDFCHKWAEAIGQSLHYAAMTGKKPGIRLICKPDSIHIKRIKFVIEYYKLPIKLEIIEKN